MATRTEKPWGYELLWSHTDHYAGKVIHINAGSRLSLQYHEQKNESVLVSSRAPSLQEGSSTSREVIYRFAEPPESDVDLIEVPTPQLDDVVRPKDDSTETVRSGTNAIRNQEDG